MSLNRPIRNTEMFEALKNMMWRELFKHIHIM